MLSEIHKILTSFPKSNWPNDEIGRNRAKNYIARNTKRGRGNVEYENSIYYKGSTTFDGSVFVSVHDGKYGILKHPKIETYGYTFE